MNILVYWLPLIKTLIVVLSFFIFCVIIAKITYKIILIKKEREKKE